MGAWDSGGCRFSRSFWFFGVDLWSIDAGLPFFLQGSRLGALLMFLRFLLARVTYYFILSRSLLSLLMVRC